jgi:hypothetical protein
LEETNQTSGQLFETITALRSSNGSQQRLSSEKLSESEHAEPPIRQPQHSDFYYKLESLNEKIRLFKEVFYSTKRDEEKRKAIEINREKHRLIIKKQGSSAAQSPDLRKDGGAPSSRNLKSSFHSKKAKVNFLEPSDSIS